MNKNSIIDYCGCILFKLFSPIIRSLPLRVSLFLGRRLGDLMYYFDLKHKTLAYSNIKAAFPDMLSPFGLSRLTKKFYRDFGQNLIDVFMIPSVNESYINKYISIEGLEYMKEGLRRGKGTILLGIHEGSWELFNIICANLGFPLNFFIRQQGYPRLNRLLNSYRSRKGCKLVQRKNQTRQLIEALKNNEVVGMTADQGGKSGILVKFFGKDASMPSGAVRLALKYDATILPGFYVRINGPYIKIIIEPPFKLKKIGYLEKDVRDNLQEIVHVFERYIRKYPEEYLWTHKIWKYARQNSILILSDAKTGHLRQAQAVANIVSDYLKEKGIKTKVNTIEVKFKNKFSRTALIFSSALAGKYHCQGCLWCLRTFLLEDTYRSLISIKPDIIISCGSTLAPINFVLSRENLSRSIVVMRPPILSTKRFDLVIMPRHDNPPRRRNVAITEGAMNLIDEDYLREQSKRLIQLFPQQILAGPPSILAEVSSYQLSDFYIGLLIGGGTKNFTLAKDIISEAIKHIKSTAEKLNADILVTTSRRTSPEIEELVKEEFKDYSRCKLLVIANEENSPFAVGGILGLSKIVIVSADSISMISEAASAGRYIVVLKSKVDRRHEHFLNYMRKRGYIHLCETQQLAMIVDKLWKGRPQINILKDGTVVREALKRLI